MLTFTQRGKWAYPKDKGRMFFFTGEATIDYI